MITYSAFLAISATGDLTLSNTQSDTDYYKLVQNQENDSKANLLKKNTDENNDIELKMYKEYQQLKIASLLYFHVWLHPVMVKFCRYFHVLLTITIVLLSVFWQLSWTMLLYLLFSVGPFILPS